MFFGKPIKLITLGSFPVMADVGSMLFPVLIAVNVIEIARVNDPSASPIVFGAIGAVLYFCSILFHELAHAGISRALGIKVHSVTLYAFGGATAAEVEDRGPREEFLVAVVGPATNLVFAAILRSLADRLVFSQPALSGTLHYLAFLNMLLAIFNILPGYPLDGGRVFRAIVWGATKKRLLATKLTAWSGQVIAVGVLGLGVLAISRQDFFGAIFSFYIGMFLFRAARGAEHREMIRTRLPAGHVSDAMRPPPTSILADIPLADSLDAFRGHESETFPVVDQWGRLVGATDWTAAHPVWQADPTRPVRDATRPMDGIPTVNADATLEDVVPIISSAHALVLREGVLVGSLTADDVLAWVKSGAAPAAH